MLLIKSCGTYKNKPPIASTTHSSQLRMHVFMLWCCSVKPLSTEGWRAVLSSLGCSALSSSLHRNLVDQADKSRFATGIAYFNA